MKTKLLLPIAIVLLMLCGCSSMEQVAEKPTAISDMSIKTAYDPEVQFPTNGAYAFVSFLPEPEENTEEIIMMERIIRQNVQRELAKKGYSIGQSGGVKFLVDYDLLMQRDIYLLTQRSRVAGMEWVDVVGYADDFVQGALLLEIIDPKTMHPIWRGVCNANVALGVPTDEERRRRAKYVISELLKPFPPK